MFATRGSRIMLRIVGGVILALGLVIAYADGLNNGRLPGPISFGIVILGVVLITLGMRKVDPSTIPQATMAGAPAGKKPNAAAGALVGLLVFGGVWYALSSGLFGGSGNITLSVGGTAGKALITYGVGGNQSQETASLPWSKKVSAKAFEPVVISAQNQDQSGTITCKIEDGSKTLASQSSSGAFVIVTCAGQP